MSLGALSWQVPAAILAGYALGSVPWGLVLSKLTGRTDPRSVGSGNIGATNVMRAGGKALGAATLLLDAGKGVAAVLLFSGGAPWAFAGTRSPLGAVAGLAAVFGHCFPVWLKLHGGKGVATYLGVAVALLGVRALALFVGLWALAWALTRIAGAASLAATWGTAAWANVACWRLQPKGESMDPPLIVALTLVVAAGLVHYRHASNIADMAQRWRAWRTRPA
jgi:glycerol-3-phosphate acyltransferase PlsY